MKSIIDKVRIDGTISRPLDCGSYRPDQ